MSQEGVTQCAGLDGSDLTMMTLPLSRRGSSGQQRASSEQPSFSFGQLKRYQKTLKRLPYRRIIVSKSCADFQHRLPILIEKANGPRQLARFFYMHLQNQLGIDGFSSSQSTVDFVEIRIRKRREPFLVKAGVEAGKLLTWLDDPKDFVLYQLVFNLQSDGVQKNFAWTQVENLKALDFASRFIYVLTDKNQATPTRESTRARRFKQFFAHLFLPFLPAPSVLGGSQGVGTLILGGVR